MNIAVAVLPHPVMNLVHIINQINVWHYCTLLCYTSFYAPGVEQEIVYRWTNIHRTSFCGNDEANSLRFLVFQFQSFPCPAPTLVSPSTSSRGKQFLYPVISKSAFNLAPYHTVQVATQSIYLDLCLIIHVLAHNVSAQVKHVHCADGQCHSMPPFWTLLPSHFAIFNDSILEPFPQYCSTPRQLPVSRTVFKMSISDLKSNSYPL